MRRQNKKRLKIAAWVVGTVGGLGLLLVLGNKSAYEREFEAATREGAIISPSELRKKYFVPADQNAADIIRRGMAVHVTGIRYDLRKTWTATSTGIDPTLLSDALSKARSLGPLDDYLSRPGCDFAYAYEKATTLQTPETGYMRQLSVALPILADDALARGDYPLARTYLQVAYKLADDVGQTPLLWATFGQIRAIQNADGAVVKIAARHMGDARTFGLLREFLAQPRRVDYVRGMEGEMCINHQMVNHLEDLIRDPSSNMGALSYWTYVPSVVRQWRTHHLRWLRWNHAMLTQYPTDWRRCSEIAEQHYREVDARDHRLPGNILDDVLEPSCYGMYWNTRQPETSRQIALAWLDILERGTRNLPSTLITPRTDAFNGAPLMLHVREKDVAICSVGPDGKDDSSLQHARDYLEIALPLGVFKGSTK